MAWFRRKTNNSSAKKEEKPKKTEKVESKKEEKSDSKRRNLAYTAASRATKPAAAPSDQVKAQKKPEAPAPQPPPEVRVTIQEPEPMRELPSNYGDNHIYLMVRDTHWMYCYWEIQSDHEERALAHLGGDRSQVKSILRVYDTTERKSQPSFFDIQLQGLVNNWYINIQPNHSYFVEIGLLHADGRFIALARSNEVTSPRDGMSEIIDERWMGIDFDKMYALSGGFEVGKSSLELRKLMEERLMGAISSGSGAGAVSSMASPVKIKKRGFWFVLDCELIVYGATEPDARVVLAGREIKLRPDGTFSLRFALPDGKYVLDAHAYSSDGIEEREITPIVTRRTNRPAPILKQTNHK